MYRVWVLGGLRADLVYQTRRRERAIRAKRSCRRKGWEAVIVGPAFQVSRPRVA